MKLLLVVIPAFNEQKTIGKVLSDVKKIKIKNMKISTVVIDDGSHDDTQKIAKVKSDYLLTHVINRGLGGALATGLEFAKIIRADYVVTFDSDGQHRALDIKKLLIPLLSNNADFVIGSRLLKKSKMPIDRKIINIGANMLTYFLWGLWITDSQSGLRALNKNAIDKVQIRMNRMEVSSEFLKEIKRNRLRLKEVSIPAIYNDYTLKKGQKNSNAINVIVKLILYKFTN